MTEKEPELIAGDAYILDDGTGKRTTHGSACFSMVNSMLRTKSVKYASLLIEQGKLDQKTPEDVDLFFTELKKVIDVKFDIVKHELGLEIVFDLKNISSHITNVAFGMMVRSLYSNMKDRFKDLSSHFLNLCKQFPDEDRGKLYTISCNIFLAGLDGTKAGYTSSVNTNHLISPATGCKIVNSKTIKSLLQAEDKMVNTQFSMTQNLTTFKNQEFCQNKYNDILSNNES